MSESDVALAAIDRDNSERFRALCRKLGVTRPGMTLQSLELGRIHAPARQEVWVVLAGELTLRTDGREFFVRTDGAVRVAPSVRRQLVNAGDAPLVLLALGGSGEHAGRDGMAARLGTSMRRDARR